METILVLKIGGNIIDDPAALSAFLSDFAKISGPKVLIHGGGKLATQLSRQLGIEPQMVDGRRITDEATLDIVTMVYGGLINKKIVAQLQAKGCNAIGLTGADAGFIQAHQRRNAAIDYGFVGDIDQLDATFLLQLLEQGITPVLAPLTHNGAGQLLNTNADSVASQTAVALARSRKVTFFYCFEKKGLLQDVNDDHSCVPQVKLADIERLKADGIVSGGMLPKVDNIAGALQQGVEKVILCHAQDVLSIIGGNSNFGTRFSV